MAAWHWDTEGGGVAALVGVAGLAELVGVAGLVGLDDVPLCRESRD